MLSITHQFNTLQIKVTNTKSSNKIIIARSRLIAERMNHAAEFWSYLTLLMMLVESSPTRRRYNDQKFKNKAKQKQKHRHVQAVWMEKLKLTSCLQVLEIRFRNISHVAVNKNKHDRCDRCDRCEVRNGGWHFINQSISHHRLVLVFFQLSITWHTWFDTGVWS